MLRNQRFLKSFILAVGLASTTLGAASAVHASALPQIQVVTDDGGVLPHYPVSGDARRGIRRAYLEARPGQRYGIKVSNPSGQRVGLVIAVDGRNVINGRRSNLRPDEPMYVLEPYQSALYEGWRTSDTRVHRFYFTEVEDSYAEAFGDRSAMGVIAVAAYREKARPVQGYAPEDRAGAPRSPAERSGAPAPARKSAEAEARSDAAGTGFGEEQASRAVRVEFEPERGAFARHFLKYEWRDTLVRLGIIPTPRERNRFWPDPLGQALPGDFAPFPPASR